MFPTPLIPGFHPDPSVVRVGEDFYLVTSTFEYLPGLPVYHSRDFVTWELVGHVVTRSSQLDNFTVPTNGGAWAPTIRFHDGQFFVAVTDALGRGTLIFTAPDPSGPWSDGTPVNIDGIDPDLAWDDDGTCFMTYSGLVLQGENLGEHHGILQVTIDVKSGEVLSSPKRLWSGTGMMFPEAPHIYRIDDFWYLFVAEGGTERGHSVSVSRSTSIAGPYEGAPHNPILSARSTARPIQNTGHADLVQLTDGTWAMALLGMRTRGMTRSFSSLGRETFATNVSWSEGWPTAQAVEMNATTQAPEFHDDFSDLVLRPEWISVRQLPETFAAIGVDGLEITANGSSLNELRPAFVGHRQQRLEGVVRASFRPLGRGGISVRYDENAHYDLEFSQEGLIARSVLSKVTHEVLFHGIEWDELWSMSDHFVLYIELIPAPAGFSAESQSCDYLELGFLDANKVKQPIATFDGRYLTAETTCSFTGRVIGLYAAEDKVVVRRFSETAI